ncbi:glutamate racemase [candidate division WOR-3 bacterium]|nr:glutamate racemase [candidate division WOR-3 bacterium]
MQNQGHKKDPIGVFDSGIGGLTVVREIRKRLPEETIIYFGDSARVPYGTKSKETILRFAKEDINFLQSFKVKVIVSACFSVSSNALDELKKEFAIPIIGMIDPGVNALSNESCGKVGVIGTNATIESDAFKKKLKDKFGDIDIYSAACPLFVPLVEEGWTEGDVPELIAESYLTPLIEEDIDSLILGCTHYPLLNSVIKNVVGDYVTIIEPGKEAAKLLEKFLIDNNLRNNGKGSLKVYLSDIPRNFERTVVNFLGEVPGGIQLVNLKD